MLPVGLCMRGGERAQNGRNIIFLGVPELNQNYFPCVSRPLESVLEHHGFPAAYSAGKWFQGIP